MNPFSILKYQIYLLQIENYELMRFWKLLKKKGYLKPSGPLRKQLIWTHKAKLVFLISVLIWVALSFIFINLNLYLAFVAAILLLAFPVFYTISLMILWPVDYILKLYYINKAKKIIANCKDLKIIGIAGSYGKTTLKYVLLNILGTKLKVKTAPGNLNTPVGISSWIVKNGLAKDTDILLIEFGEEYRGDNKKIADIFSQNISIINGISEAHFERLGSIENIAATIFEAVENSSDETKVYLNSDDINVMKSYDKYIGKRKVEFYSQKNSLIKNKEFKEDKNLWIAEIDKIGQVEIPFLAEYVFADIEVVILIAEEFDLSPEEIKKGLMQIKPVEHRLQPIPGAQNVLVIDDSYNSNPVGVAEAINVLGRYKSRRKLYITPGVVESGESNKRIHTEIGCKLAAVADKVILIKNSATPYIAEGLVNSGFAKESIIWFETAQEAHSSLGQILKPNDVILFQNDWGDQHL